MRNLFGRRNQSANVTIPVRGNVDAVYVVYVAPAGGSIPGPDSLGDAARHWTETHLQPPLQSVVSEFQGRALVSMQAQRVDQLPQPPIGVLRYTGLGELEERVLTSATHAVVVGCPDLNAPPRVGLWTALATALAVAELTGGVIFDPEALRIVKPDAAKQWFSERGTIAVSKHVIVPFSLGHQAGLGWMTTRGLGKFGLDDLELRDVSPNLDRLNVLVNAVAQALVETTLAKSAEAKGEISLIVMPTELQIDASLVGRAHGRPASGEFSRPVVVSLSHDPRARAPEPPMIRIQPPQGESDAGVWLNRVAGVLLGSTNDVRMANTDSDRMTEAHQRAINELPYARDRFHKGLRPGELLFVKRGFDTASGSKEYLWLVVTQWSGDQIVGQIANEPLDVPSITSGQTVTISAGDLFDWMIQVPGDRDEGGYTSQVAMEDDKR